MCGIAGYYGRKEIHINHLESCLKLMHHRGPDHSAYYSHSFSESHHVYLLNSRLSILDLDPRANQPYTLGNETMVYNGELYNYLELKQKLTEEGSTFRTTGDTEVMIKLLGHYGWQNGLDICEGMWAFALYNKADGNLLLCRDRFGEKPLYLYKDDSGLYFASEIKFITALLGRTPAINYEQLYRYLVNGYKSLNKRNATFFKGVTELKPGSVLVVDAESRESEAKYWDPSYEQSSTMSYKEALSGVRERLIKSVKLRLRADVPLAFCMSGGVDSNSLISIAKNVLNYDVHGFTILNKDARYEEQDMVDHAVKELKIRHTAIQVNPDSFIEKLRRLVTHHDAPVYTITYYAHWLLMESIADNGYRISVSGTAADELFSGYYDHHLAYLCEIQDDAELFEESLDAWEKHIKPIVRNPFLQNPRAFIENPELREHIYLNADEFAGYLNKNWQEPFYEYPYSKSLLRNRMLNELFHESVPPILHEDDLNAMYYSVENRSPFLDRELFEFSQQIPTRHLIRDGMAKAVLRDAMKGIVPEKIITNRRKVGFNAPIFSYLDVCNPEVKAYLLDDSPIYDHISRSAVEKLIAKPDLPNSESKFLFYFLSSKLFLEAFDK